MVSTAGIAKPAFRGVELGREAIRLEPSESDGYAATAACLYTLPP